MEPLLLASTSPFRSQLLRRLGLPFEVRAPEYAEEPVPGLDPEALARHHAVEKARSLAARYPERIVVGSDQVAVVAGRLLGKPGGRAAAVAQLAAMSGRRVAFHTGLAVLRGAREATWVETVWTRLRPLSREEIEAYVDVDEPYGSAGAFRIEGLGIALMEAVESVDPTALIGLPLIALTRLLGELGVNVLLEARRAAASSRA
ncbi:MAG: Maf family nucleotide pyrophosphatase [Deferrisomatales bacterium]